MANNDLEKSITEEGKKETSSSEEYFWEPYVGKEVTINYQGDMYTGKFNEPNLNGGWADLLPCLGGCVSGRAYVERETPMRIPLNLLESLAATVRPRYDGFMDEHVAEVNMKLDRKDRRISFHNKS